MDQFSMNLNRKVNFHQINGIVYLPSKANQKTLYIPQIKTNEESEIGFEMTLYIAKNFIANQPFSRRNVKGRMCWIFTSADSGAIYSEDLTNREILATVRNNNAHNLEMLDSQPAFNAICVNEGRLAEIPVFSGNSIDLSQNNSPKWDHFFAKTLDLYSVYKGWEAMVEGRPYVSYSKKGINQFPEKKSLSSLRSYSKKLIGEITSLYNELISDGTFVTSSAIYCPANSIEAICCEDSSIRYNQVNGVYKGAPVKYDPHLVPSAFGRINPTNALRIVGIGTINKDAADLNNPLYTSGLQFTGSDDDDYIRTQYSRRFVEFDSLRGERIMGRAVLYGSSEVRGSKSRPEIFEEAILSNDTISFESGCILTFESRYGDADGTITAPWCVTPRIVIGSYSVSNNGVSLPAPSGIDSGIDDIDDTEEDDTPFDLDVNFMANIKPSEITPSGSNPITESRSIRQAEEERVKSLRQSPQPDSDMSDESEFVFEAE